MAEERFYHDFAWRRFDFDSSYQDRNCAACGQSRKCYELLPERFICAECFGDAILTIALQRAQFNKVERLVRQGYGKRS